MTPVAVAQPQACARRRLRCTPAGHFGRSHVAARMQASVCKGKCRAGRCLQVVSLSPMHANTHRVPCPARSACSAWHALLCVQRYTSTYQHSPAQMCCLLGTAAHHSRQIRHSRRGWGRRAPPLCLGLQPEGKSVHSCAQSFAQQGSSCRPQHLAAGRPPRLPCPVAHRFGGIRPAGSAHTHPAASLQSRMSRSRSR